MLAEVQKLPWIFRRTDNSIEAIESATMEPENSSDDDFAFDEDDFYIVYDSDYERRRRKRHKPSGGTSTTGEKALDRISNLPDSVLIHILSFLPTKYAIKTSILAQRWRYLWTFIPILDFYDNNLLHQSREKLQRFISFVNRALILIESPKVNKFRVQLTYRKAIAADVDAWLRFATRKNVEELELSFIKERPISLYVLPRNMLHNSTLVTLKLSYCMIEQCVSINWSSLKVLSLSKMALSNDMIREMLLGCPLIELLELRDCFYYNVLDIKSETLRKLVVDDYMGPSSSALNISAPNIQSLEIAGFLNMSKISINNLSSLVEAKLTFRLMNGPSDVKECAKILSEMFQNLWHVKDLTMGNWCLLILSVLEKKVLLSSFSNRMSLKLETQLTKWELPGIRTLLALTPLLDTLIIDFMCNGFQLSESFKLEPVLLESFDFDQENYWPSQKSFFASALLNLKTIKIGYFMGMKEEIEIISFLLKNARWLEKMTIQRIWWLCIEKSSMVDTLYKTEFQEVVQSLLSLPRCSRDAVVVIS